MNQLPPHQDPSGAGFPEREVHLFDYLDVILRRKWSVILFFLITVTAAAAYTLWMTPVFEATASLLIQEKKKGSEMILGELTGLPTQSEIPSQLEIIKSRTIAEEVVRKLRYDQKVFDVSKNLEIRLESFEIPEGLTEKVFQVTFVDDQGNFSVAEVEPESFLRKVLAFFRVSETAADQARPVGAGSVGNPFSGEGGLAFTVKGQTPAKDACFKIVKAKFNDSVSGVQQKLTVSPVRNTNVIKVSVQDSDPVMAATLANTVIRHFIQQDVSQRSKESKHVIDFVEQQLLPTQQKLDTALEALARHKSKSQLIDLQEGTRNLIEKIGELEKERTEVAVKERQIKYLYDIIQRDVKDISTLTLSVLDDTNVRNRVSRLIDLESNRTSLLADYTEKHPQVMALTREIAELKTKINPAILNILDSIGNRNKSLFAETENLRDKLKAIPDEEKDLAGLVLNKEVLSNINTFLFQKLNEATIAQASTISSIQVIDPAIVPEKPIKPQKKRNLLLALIVGLMGGIGLAFFFDYLDNSFKSPRDVEERVGIPVFGRIPYIPEKSGPGFLVTLEHPKSVGAESYRSLRTNLQFAGMEKGAGKARIVHVTSSEASEGKSTITANLGVTLALMGNRTLIVDLDLRKPAINKVFGIEKEPGITNFLAGHANLEEILHSKAADNLDVIPSGVIPPNPSELLSQKALYDFLEQMRQKYDYILLDSPPVLPVTDAQILGRIADIVFLVIELGKTGIPAVEQAVRQLQAVDAHLAGSIINKIQLTRKYGYYSSQYYYYASYYGDEPKKKKKRGGQPKE
jgi:tyrosine-protein kinase Etk/Wzc